MESIEKKQKRVLLCVGVPGSGKSTWISNHMDANNDIVISRDAIRFALLQDDQDYFAVENQVREEFFKQIRDYTADGYSNNVFIDATHLNRKSRKQILNCIKDNPYKIAVSFEVPIDVALERNAQRTGRALVPESAIHNMYARFEKPSFNEGFDEIWHIDAEGKIRKEFWM